MLSTFLDDTDDTTPEPNYMLAVMTRPWSMYLALAELVDNSYGKGRGNASRVEIIHDTSKHTLTVIDNGQGMDRLVRLFRLGSTIGRFAGDIGIYGAGGTEALPWIAHQVEIWTLRDGKVCSDSVDFVKHLRENTYPRISNKWLSPSPANTPEALLEFGQGTMIVLHLHTKRRSMRAHNVTRDLAATYAPATRQGKELIWTTVAKNGQESPSFLTDRMIRPNEAKASVDIDVVVTVSEEMLPVTGLIEVIPDLPVSRSQIAVSFGGRVVQQTRDCFDSPDGSERYSGNGVCGYLDLGEGWQEYLTTTKSGFDDTDAWNALMGYIFKQIRQMLIDSEDQSINLQLTGIALELSKALSGTVNVQVHVNGKPLPRQEGTGHPNGDGEPRGPQGPHKRRLYEPNEGKEAETESSVTNISLYPATDMKMESRLCTAVLDGSSIAIFINRDHSVVKEAIKSRAINRMALHLMATREIAAIVASNKEILQKMFPKASVRRHLESLPDDLTREQFLQRVLMDCVVSPASITEYSMTEDEEELAEVSS